MNKKDEALKMAIEAFKNVINEYSLINMRPPIQVIKAIQECKDALNKKKELS